MNLIRIIFFGFLISSAKTCIAKSSAYPVGPYFKDGYYHIIWMWRETEIASTNSHLSYAKSKDLESWLTCKDQKINVPLRKSNEFIVEKGLESDGIEDKFMGLLNSRQKLSFVNDDIVITYLLNDDKGSQIFTAKKDGCDWEKNKITNNCEFLDLDSGGTLRESKKLDFSNIYYKDSHWRINIANKLKQCEGSKQIDGSYILDGNLKLNYLNIVKSYENKTARHKIIKKNQYLRDLMTVKSNDNELVWLAKENNGDLKAKCLPLKCRERDFYSKIYLIRNGEISVVMEGENELLVWGGAQNKYAYIDNNGSSYLAYFDAKSKCLSIALLKGNVLEDSYCLEKHNNIWDSHNYITLMLYDDALYITGNVHNNNINIYSIKDISARFSEPKLVKHLNGSFTYPRFISTNNTLLLMIRNGISGDGKYEIYDLINTHDRKWEIFYNG